jgi:hypothetical protein
MAILDELKRAQKLGLIAYDSEGDTWSVSSNLKKRLASAASLKFDVRTAIYLCVTYVAGDLRPQDQERFADLVYYISITEPITSSALQASK